MRVTLRRSVAPAAVLTALLLVGSCGGSDDGASSTTAATAATEAPAATAAAGATTPADPCTPRAPGEIVPQAEAVIRLRDGQVCPGYLTVAPGTAVTWRNEATSSWTITVRAMTPTGPAAGDPVTSFTVDPGTSTTWPFGQLGTFAYTIDAIPTFTGVVEVTTSDGTHGGHGATTNPAG
jgi:plastocyanin